MRQWKKINGTDRAWWSHRRGGHRRSTCRCSGQGRGLCWVSSAASSFCPSNLPAILAPLAHRPLFFLFSLTFLSLGGVVVGKDGLKERVPPKWKEREVVFVRAEQTGEVTPFFFFLLLSVFQTTLMGWVSLGFWFFWLYLCPVQPSFLFFETQS